MIESLTLLRDNRLYHWTTVALIECFNHISPRVTWWHEYWVETDESLVVSRWTCTSSSSRLAVLCCKNETLQLSKLCSKSPLTYKHKENCHCVAFQQHQALLLTDIVSTFPLMWLFRMIIVWCIQYGNVIIVRGAGSVVTEQEMTCQDLLWPQRESGDLRLTPMFVLGSDWDGGTAAAPLTREEGKGWGYS